MLGIYGLVYIYLNKERKYMLFMVFMSVDDMVFCISFDFAFLFVKFYDLTCYYVTLFSGYDKRGIFAKTDMVISKMATSLF